MDNPRTDNDKFAASRECFTEVLGWLEGSDAAALSHAELEDQLDAAAGSCSDGCSRIT